MSSLQHRLRFGGILFLCENLLLGTFWYQRHSVSLPSSPQPTGIQEIIDRTDSLCRLLIPKTPALHYQVDQQTGHSPQETPQPYWEILCLDKDEKEYARFRWNKKHKELFSLSRPTPSLQAKVPTTTGATSHWKPSRLSRTEERQLVGLAWKWLDQMGVAKASSRWQLTHSPDSTAHPDIWAVQVGSSDRRAMLILNRVTGELVALSTSRRSPPPPAQRP